MILVAAAFAGTYTDDFSADQGAWDGGTVADGVLTVTDGAATFPFAPAAFTLTARVRLTTEGTLGFGPTPHPMGVEIAPERGAVTFAGEAMPLPMSHLTWVPDADPVLEPGAGYWEAGSVLHCEVARDDDGGWLLYYTGVMSPGYGYRQIGVATSADGVSWTRYASNPVLTIDYSADVDGVHVHMPTVVRDGADWHMYYSCYQNNVGNRICHATSDDGLDWTPQGVALDKGATGEFDAGSLRMPDVWIDDAGLWHLWYDGTDPDQHYGPTGYATSADGWTWTKQGQILAKADALQGLSVVESPYGLEAFYNIDDKLGHATGDPADPAVWLETGVVLEKGWGWWNDGYLQAPSVLLDDVTWRMWFNAYTYTDATERLGTAHTEPAPGEWLDVAFGWDGATLTMTVDGATRTMDVANLGDLELTATGTAELDDVVVEWTEPVIEDTGEPEDTASEDTAEDTATEDSAADDTAPQDSDADEVIGEADGCGCGSGVGVGAAWALAALLAVRRRSQSRLPSPIDYLPRMRHLLFTFLAACTVEKIPTDPVDSGGTEEDCQRSWWVRDADGDGFGDDLDAVSACDAPDGYIVTGGDCDDQVATTYPGALETCNGVDDDCDGIGDDADASWYDDADGDGFGDPATLVVTCQPAAGQVQDGTDCDDADAGAHPGAEEICGDLDDDDCDGFADIGAESADWHTDDDGDGFGHMYNHEVACDPDPAWVLDGTDCRPNDAEAFPGAAERCNDDDDNCDRQVDEGFDEDGDGFLSTVCDGGDDCDDAHAEAWPGNPEDACEDGIDGDCDGLDRPCGFWGETLATDMDAYVYSDQASFDAGRLVDVGDATGDGIGDVLVATLYAGSYGGAGYLIPGPVTGTDTLENLGHRIEGSTGLTYGAGRSIGIGDLDGDGIEDVGFGAPYGSYAGMYVELGPIAEDRDLTSPDIYLECQSSIYCGHGGDIGDVSGDGVADAVVGAYATSGSTGTVYIAQGPLTGDLNLNDDADVEIEGESAGYYTARHIYAGGDYDGDGLSDLQVAAPYASAGRSYGGIVYVLLAPVTITDFSMADARMIGPSNSSYLGTGAAMGSGDVDGDGYDDVGVGASMNASSSSAGGAYVVFGPVSGDYDVGTDADITVEGAASGDYAGTSVAMGDINDDGIDELLIGASGDRTGGASAGSAFLFLTPTAGSWLTSDADASFPSTMASAAAGTAVVLKDTNGDGADDVVVGAPGDSTGATAGGAVYLQQAGF